MTGTLLPTVVLASASPARRAVLQAAGIDPVVLVSGVDEDAVAAGLGDAKAQDVVVALATAKAQAVAAEFVDHYPDAVVIGCDSMLHLDGTLLGKPHTAAGGSTAVDGDGRPHRGPAHRPRGGAGA